MSFLRLLSEYPEKLKRILGNSENLSDTTLMKVSIIKSKNHGFLTYPFLLVAYILITLDWIVVTQISTLSKDRRMRGFLLQWLGYI